MSDSGTIRILQFTDLHQTASPGEQLLNVDTSASLEIVYEQAFEIIRPDLVLLTGDIAHHPDIDVYRRTLETLQRYYRGPWLWTPGNHDLSAPMHGAIQALGRREGDTRETHIDAWAFYMIDTHADDQVGGSVSDDEMERLARFLTSSTSAHVLIAGHHPFHDVGTPWLDTDRVANADSVLQLLVRDGRVRAYLSGHVHQPSEACHCGIRMLTTPSTCFQFRPGSLQFTVDDRPPGWRQLELATGGDIRTIVQRATT
jgi:3',5'-cyclic-AMP phosphodiesterase